MHYVVFALFPEHVGVDARLYFELVLGSYQVRWAGKVPMVPHQIPPGDPGMWGFGLFWERVVPGEPGIDLLCPGWLRGMGGGKGRENMSTEGSSPFLWLEIVLPVLSRASWWLCSTVSSTGR